MRFYANHLSFFTGPLQAISYPSLWKVAKSSFSCPGRHLECGLGAALDPCFRRRWVGETRIGCGSFLKGFTDGWTGSFPFFLEQLMPSSPTFAGKKKRFRVALLIETSNAYARGLLRGIYSYIREHGSWSTFFPEQSRGDLPPKNLIGWRGDGIIARIENEAIAEVVSNLNIPVVDVSASQALQGIPWVETHDESIAQLAVDHLLERGFRNFAFCGDNRFAWSRYRCDGMKRLVEKAGYEFFSYGVDDESKAINEERQLTRWLQKLPKPVGVLACYDIRGRQLIEICQRNNIAVPEQIAILGVDNDELVCNLAETPLSSIMPNAKGTGYLAASLLSQMLDGEPVEGKAHLLKPLGIVTRQSTDSFAIDDAELIKAAQYIREHACSGMNVEDILKVVPLTRRVLEARFKKYFGHSPHDAIQRVRLRRAEELLTETDLSLATIADRSGFVHSEYFSVVFKRMKEITPSAYRSQMRSFK